MTTRRTILLGAGAAALASATRATAATPDFQSVHSAAVREGHLTVWMQAPSKPETHEALIAAFNKRFALDIKVEWVVIPATTSNTRAIAETSGGHVSVDVIGPGAAEEVAVAADAGLVKPYPWTAVFGATLPRVAALEALMIPALKGMALPYIIASYGLVWNPQMIKAADLPAKFTDLVAPEWSGRVGVNSFFLVPLDVASYVMGEQAALEWARKMIANKPIYERGTPAVASAVATGQVPIGITVSPVAEFMMRQKQPISYRLFSDIIPVSQLHAYVPEAAPHPNAARLFTAWLAAEGVPIADRFEPFSSPADPSSAVMRMINAQVKASDARIAAPHSLADLKASKKLRDEVALLLNGQAPK
jgi:ABC-type Fe3+ transport system substrate-binding protein